MKKATKKVAVKGKAPAGKKGGNPFVMEKTMGKKMPKGKAPKGKCK